jgi:hypothetical protein
MRAALLLALAACGPSASEVRIARTATYAERPGEVFVRAQRAANTLFGIATADAAQLGFITRPFLDVPSGDPRYDHNSAKGHRVMYPARVGIAVRVVALPSGRALVVLAPRAQRSAACQDPCSMHWVDVPLRDVEPFAVDVQHEIDRLAVAIHDGER